MNQVTNRCIAYPCAKDLFPVTLVILLFNTHEFINSHRVGEMSATSSGRGDDGPWTWNSKKGGSRIKDKKLTSIAGEELNLINQYQEKKILSVLFYIKGFHPVKS